MVLFKFDDCFKSCGIFNEILIKRFEENFNPQTGSRLWMTPGHVVFTSDSVKIHTCDARPYDLTSSPSEPDSDELLNAVSPVLEIFFDTQTSSTRMFVVLNNGDVQIFEYRILLFEWARIGYFNVNIVSPNSNNNHHPAVTQVLISHCQNMIYWSEHTGTSEMGFDLHKREIPLNGVREITQSAIGVPQKILKNCPRFDLIEICDNLCIIPHLPNAVNLYLILSARSHIWLFNINGKCLWRGVVTDSPIDFISLCAKTAGLWIQGGIMKVCKLLDSNKSKAQILLNDTLLFITFTGEISKKTSINFNTNTNDCNECFIIQNSLFSFTDKSRFIYVHNINNGNLIQMLDLSEKAPISGLWHHSSNIPSIGFYTDNMIYKINYKSLRSILNSDPPCFAQALNILGQEHFLTFALLKDSVHHKFIGCDVPSLKTIPNALQSEALLLAVLHLCREKGPRSSNFPLKESVMQDILFSEHKNVSCETKLKESLYPLVDCFLKIEKSRVIQKDHVTGIQ